MIEDGDPVHHHALDNINHTLTQQSRIFPSLSLLLPPFQNDLAALTATYTSSLLVSIFIQVNHSFIQRSLRHMSLFGCINFLLEP
jgi:hypothetical protein